MRPINGFTVTNTPFGRNTRRAFRNGRTLTASKLRETEGGLRDSLEHLWPYIVEMRSIEEGFTEEERAVISRFLKAATEATHRHAEKLSREQRQDPPAKPDT